MSFKLPSVSVAPAPNLPRGGTVVIASGAEHRRLSIPKLNRFAGVGVYYGSKQSCNEVTKNLIDIKVEMERIARGDLN